MATPKRKPELPVAIFKLHSPDAVLVDCGDRVTEPTLIRWLIDFHRGSFRDTAIGIKSLIHVVIGWSFMFISRWLLRSCKFSWTHRGRNCCVSYWWRFGGKSTWLTSMTATCCPCQLCTLSISGWYEIQTGSTQVDRPCAHFRYHITFRRFGEGRFKSSLPASGVFMLRNLI
jgi:hypothetical protein